MFVKVDKHQHFKFFISDTTPIRRGVTRLDSVRGKKQVWHSHVEANLLY